jgi:hypothetical protein
MMATLITAYLPTAPIFALDATVMKIGNGKAEQKPLNIWIKDVGRRLSEAVVKLVKASRLQPFEAAQ